MATMIPADVAMAQSDFDFEVREDDGDQVAYLQSLIGGPFQFVYLGDGSALLVVEDGKLIGLPLNPRATAIAKLKRAIFEQDSIVGPAVFLSREDLHKMAADEESQAEG